MSEHSKLLISKWLENPISRKSLLGSIFVTLIASTSVGKSMGAVTPILSPILGRPTDTSCALNLITSQNVTAYIEYGFASNSFVNKTSVVNLQANNPVEFELEGLLPNNKIFYRIAYRSAGKNTFLYSKQYSFSTQKSVESNFSFTVHGDTHPERAGKMFNSDLYKVTLANILSQQPDFHILMGDDFSIDPLISKKQATKNNVEKVYKTHRDWLTIAGNSVPIYLVNGNHEQAAAYLLDGTQTNPAILAGSARLKYFPLPAPNYFYTGNSTQISGLGLPRDYYAWNWGDALFVTLDPYWHSKNPVDNVAGELVAEDQSATGAKKKSTNTAGGGKSKNLWAIGIGDEQYLWLKKTLENSKAKYKFVFAHHVMGTGRGAVELSYDYEWGGKDPKGVTTFAKERPNWELPIHDLMVKNKVSIFFQGHDHIFVTQERDGLIYQSMPNPADDTFSYFNDAAYKSGVKAPNSGHVRVTVTQEYAKVEYFLAARPKDTNRKNKSVAHTYLVKPL